MTESPNNTALSPNFITDSSAGLWGLAPSLNKANQVVHNGSIQTNTANVVLLLYFNHKVYHVNASNNWYVWSGTSWTSTTDPRVVILPESPSGTSVTTVGPAIVNSVLESWTLMISASSGLQIACNGVVDPVTSNVVMLYYANRLLYQTNSSGGWWYKARSSDPWSVTTDPRIVAPAITNIMLSNASFAGGAPSGTIVGSLTVSMSSGSFSGVLSLSGNAFFSLVGNNIITNGVVPAGSYSVTATATQAGAAASPFTKVFSLTAIASGSLAAPAQAVAAGFKTLAFDDDFTSANTIATSASAASGYKWYWSFAVGSYITSSSWSVNPIGTATGSNASVNGGVLTLNSVRGSNSGFWGNSTLCTLPGRAISNGVIPAGTAWQHGYFEMYAKTSPNGLGSNSPYANGWPAFWSWSAEGAQSFGFSNLSGPSTEVDFMEVTGGVNWGSSVDPVGHDAAAIHNPGGSSVVYSAGFPTLDNNWHTWGCLWKAGSIQFFYDNVAVGTAHSTAGWNLENTHLFAILGTGIGWPMYVDWVRVWTV